MEETKATDRYIAKVSDYQAAFDTKAGMTVLYDLMTNCHINSSAFNPDPYMHAFNEGKRDVVLRIMTMIGYDVAEIQKRMKEAHDYAREYN